MRSLLPAGEGLSMSSIIPDESSLRELHEAAVRLARGAGRILLEYQPGSTSVDYKGKLKTDPVTEADLRIEEFLREEIAREFPEHGVVGEESEESAGSKDADYVWVIDPVDGTANFAAGVPFYAVSIGLLYRGAPVAGSLYLPHSFAGEGVYHCRAGGGAFVEDTPLKVSDEPFPKASALAGVPAGFGWVFSLKRGSGRVPGETRTMGSIACEMVLVARGVFEYSVFGGSRIWDVAAGVALVREAGGMVMEWREGEWRPLQRFEPRTNVADEGAQQALRRWGAPLLVGRPAAVEYLAPRLAVRGGPFRALRSRIQRAVGRRRHTQQLRMH